MDEDLSGQTKRENRSQLVVVIFFCFVENVSRKEEEEMYHFALAVAFSSCLSLMNDDESVEDCDVIILARNQKRGLWLLPSGSVDSSSFCRKSRGVACESLKCCEKKRRRRLREKPL